MKAQQVFIFYKHHLEESLLPFWKRAMDLENGGVFTCFNNNGDTLLSTDKYIWSQGRFVWIWSRIAELCQKGIVSGSSDIYLKEAGTAAHFILDHAIMEDDRCVFLTSKEGTKKETSPGSGYDTSIFVDCFVAMGFAEYGRVSGERVFVEKSLQLLDSIRSRVETGNYRSEPYPVPDGFSSHSIPMILLNVASEVTHALASIQHPRTAEVKEMCRMYMDTIINEYRSVDGLIIEYHTNQEVLKDSMLYRHHTPGHALESMWFVLEEACRLGRHDIISKAVQSVKRAFELGWDKEAGGLFRYVDKDGAQPSGRRLPVAFESNISDTWDTKIWWVHSEALYVLMLSFHITGDNELLEMYEQVKEYTFRVFPNPDLSIGEWIQIRDRHGEPLERVVALPVKDPYHIIRNMLLLLELMQEG